MSRGVPGSTPGHGSLARAKTCKCAPCKAKRAAYEKRRKILGYSRLDGAGTYRRLRALAALGWPSGILGERLGISSAAVLERTRSEATADRFTAARIKALYDELSMTPGPSRLTRSRSATKGWLPPLVWDDESIDDPNAKPIGVNRSHHRQDVQVIDEVAIERVLSGHRAELTKAERLIVVERLAAAGLSDAQIADRVGVSDRTIFRDRDENGIESRWAS